MLNRLSIGVKLLLIAIIPLLGLLILEGDTLRQDLGRANEALQLTTQADLSARAVDLIQSLQAERNAAVDVVTGGQSAAEGLAEPIAATDDAVAAYGVALGQVEGPNTDEIADVDEIEAELQETREAVGPDTPFGDVLDGYAEVLGELFETTDEITENLEGVGEIESAESAGSLTRGIDALARESDVLLASQNLGVFDNTLFAQAIGIRGAATAYLSDAEEAVSGEAAELVESLSDISGDSEIAVIYGLLTAGGEQQQVAEFLDQRADRLDVLNAARADIGRDVVDEVNQASQELQISVLFVALGGTVLILTVMGLSFLVAGRLSKNVRHLTASAKRVATTDLPNAVEAIRLLEEGEPRPELEPIRSQTADELGTMAAALTRVQDAALEAAYEQNQNERAAQEMLVNLGRRNQALLNRTLSYLSELERDEEDSETLEQLFRLDHLATRIRRNAESMLVLAGSDQTRTWRAPVAMMDVLRSSLSEIEEYERIDLHTVEETKVNGSAVADIAHVLAELLENATRFSSQEERVTVVGRETQDGYVLSITDRGIGMGEHELAEANRRIRRAGLDRPDSKVLGHYVVGRLAARRDIGVELLANDMGGVTVRVRLPQHLLVPTQPATPELHAPTAAQPQPAAQPPVSAQPPAVFDAQAEPQPYPPAQADAPPVPDAQPTWDAQPTFDAQPMPDTQPTFDAQPAFDAQIELDPQVQHASGAQPTAQSHVSSEQQAPTPAAPATSNDEWSTLAQTGTETPAPVEAPAPAAAQTDDLPSFEPSREAPAVPDTTPPEPSRRVTPLRQEHGNIPPEWGSTSQSQPASTPQWAGANQWSDLPSRRTVDATPEPMNGTPTNGASSNGAALNGAALNGAAMNGAQTNGVPMNGTAAESSDKPVSELPTRPPRRPGNTDGSTVGQRVRGAQMPDTGPEHAQELPQREPDQVRNSLAGLQRGVSMARESSGSNVTSSEARPTDQPASPAPRVRGAQMPDTGPDEQAGDAAHRPADQVRNSLAGFQSSVSRARREAQDPNPNTISGGTR